MYLYCTASSVLSHVYYYVAVLIQPIKRKIYYVPNCVSFSQ